MKRIIEAIQQRRALHELQVQASKWLAEQELDVGAAKAPTFARDSRLKEQATWLESMGPDQKWAGKHLAATRAQLQIDEGLAAARKKDAIQKIARDIRSDPYRLRQAVQGYCAANGIPAPPATASEAPIPSRS